MPAKDSINSVEDLSCLNAINGTLYTSVVYVEGGPKPLILNGLILRAWGNGNNRIERDLVDLHQYKDEMVQVFGK